VSGVRCPPTQKPTKNQLRHHHEGNNAIATAAKSVALSQSLLLLSPAAQSTMPSQQGQPHHHNDGKVRCAIEIIGQQQQDVCSLAMSTMPSQ